jgi:hypothetical protein
MVFGATDLPVLAASPTHHGPALGGTASFREIESLIESRGNSTLCEISNITPNAQGGLSTIKIFSFSTTTRCDAHSTAQQGGVLYLVQTQSTATTKLFLALAANTPAFEAGWQSGQTAIVVGTGVTALRQLEIYSALMGYAHFAFRR